MDAYSRRVLAGFADREMYLRLYRYFLIRYLTKSGASHSVILEILFSSVPMDPGGNVRAKVQLKISLVTLLRSSSVISEAVHVHSVGALGSVNKSSVFLGTYPRSQRVSRIFLARKPRASLPDARSFVTLNVLFLFSNFLTCIAA